MSVLKLRRTVAAAVVALAIPAASLAPALSPAGAPVASAQAENNDPALQQTVTADERIAPLGESVVLSAGHADLGPIIVDGELTFMVRDDSQSPPVWRHLEDVTFRVSDAAVQSLPEGDDFAFTGAKPGDKVWVIPQSEVAAVPWLGWNTQSPGVVERADRGISMEFGGHQGPGDFTLFLQPGGFAQPQQLWNSRIDGAQPMWVELNTHTHANWVFTQPGVHLVGIRAVVKDKDGSSHTVQQAVRLAVGDSTDVAQAQTATFDGPWREGDGVSAQTDDATPEQAGISPLVWAAVGVGALALILVIGSAVTMRRARRRRAAALAAVRARKQQGQEPRVEPGQEHREEGNGA